MKSILIIAFVAVAVLALLNLRFWNDEATFRSDVPIGRTTATKELPDFPLPLSAHAIYYLWHAGGLQDLEFYARFDVEPQDLDSAVDALVAWNNGELSRSLSYPRDRLSSARIPPPRDEFLPMRWWDPDTVSSGYYRGHLESYALRMIVDQSRSRIYLHQND
jgi:hypothetical protein